jgi:uncharacterized protein (TIGR03067 family)
MRTLVMLLALSLTSPTSAAGPDALAGAWTAMSAEQDGAAAEGLIGHRLEFTDDGFAITDKNGQLLYAGSYTVDDSTAPARIDFRHDRGQAAGATWEGIYRLDGDQLTIVDDAPDPAKGRPAEFTAAAGSGHVLLVFAR